MFTKLISSKYFIPSILAIIILIALYLRVWIPFHYIFADGWVRFITVDAYHHLRIIDNLIANFPHLLQIDPYWGFPQNTDLTAGTYLFHYIIATIAWLIGFGQPSQHVIEVVTAIIPPIMVIGIIITVFYIGKYAFNKWVGLFASGLVATFGGEFISRSTLGSSDYHVAEVLFTSLFILFFVLAIKNINKNKIRIYIYLGLSFISLVIYIFTWTGHLLFCLIFFIFAAIVVLYNIQKRKQYNPYAFYGGLAGVVIVVCILTYFIAPTLFAYLKNAASMFVWFIGTSTAEEMPLLIQDGRFTLAVAWGNFAGSFYLSLIMAGFLLRESIKNKDYTKWLVFIWFAIILLVTLSMRRFNYYLAVPVSLLAGYALWLIIDIVKNQKEYTKYVLVVVIFFMAVYIPNYTNALATVKPIPLHQSYYNTAWREAIEWLEDNTDKPFEDVDYYTFYEHDYEPEYTVLSWWDYGYWITRDAQRVPICNPGGGARDLAGWYFINSDVEQANEILNDTKVKYIVIDYEMAVSKYYAMPLYAYKFKHTDKMPDDYMQGYEMAFDKEGKEYQAIPLWYEDYYNSMLVRLYCYDGKAYQSPGTPVITYETKGEDRILTAVNDFPNYVEAKAFVDSDDKRIVGLDPFVSPIDLQELSDYELVFESQSMVQTQFMSGAIVPRVKIYEYKGE